MTAPAETSPLSDGYTLHQFDSIDGTNAEALRSGARPGHVYIARTQSAGRGRQGRNWVSPGGNLYATICTQPPSDRNPAQLAFVAGLAVFDTVSEEAPDTTFTLKWPNDILADGKKISGMLIEAGERGYAVGIGINIVASPPDDEVRYPATSLRECTGITPQPYDLLTRLCHHFDTWNQRWVTGGFEPLRAVWLASAHRMGDTIAASTGVDRIEGRFQGLDADGALVLEDAGGTVHVITAGDVFFPGAD
jgi:BirA family transcriptional regulator, biotin operon repressor / biotin---[acetyl-CoA-carboxylase] ligase